MSTPLFYAELFTAQIKKEVTPEKLVAKTAAPTNNFFFGISLLLFIIHVDHDTIIMDDSLLFLMQMFFGSPNQILFLSEFSGWLSVKPLFRTPRDYLLKLPSECANHVPTVKSIQKQAALLILCEFAKHSNQSDTFYKLHNALRSVVSDFTLESSPLLAPEIVVRPSIKNRAFIIDVQNSTSAAILHFLKHMDQTAVLNHIKMYLLEVCYIKVNFLYSCIIPEHTFMATDDLAIPNCVLTMKPTEQAGKTPICARFGIFNATLYILAVNESSVRLVKRIHIPVCPHNTIASIARMANQDYKGKNTANMRVETQSLDVDDFPQGYELTLEHARDPKYALRLDTTISQYMFRSKVRFLCYYF